VQTVEIFAPIAEEVRFLGAIGHPLSSEGKIIPSLQVIHLDPSYDVDDDQHVEDTMFDILYSIECWAAWFNTQKEQVPGFRQYDSTNPPVFVADEVPPAWSRFFHQRFRRSRPYLKEIE
jgi:hypothetical protein